LIFSTGAIDSTLFFLLYFLGFGVAFVFEPVVTFVFVLGVILVFIPDVIKGDLLVNSLKLGSLLLISPLAFFFGNEYRKNDKQTTEIEALEERTTEAANTISQDIEEVIKDEKTNLKSEDMEKLNEILEETEDLRAESAK
jgi:energy-coupling factor transporter transmembrane protein EcfT